MQLENKERFRNMNAYLYDGFNIDLRNEKTGQVYIIPRHAIVFKSYSSICAVFDCDEKILYLLPRWDYSVTTLKQLNKFVNEYTNMHYPGVKYLRDIESGKQIDHDIIFVSGYKDGSQVKRY